jgi:26S proteasome regulatory subunit N8
VGCRKLPRRTTPAAMDSHTVSVAPLVLLSVVDHYERVIKAASATTSLTNANSRVIGAILGDNSNPHEIRVSNSFAVPYEEDPTNSDIWFLDHNYIDTMMEMFKKINAKEKLIGWYHSGPKLRTNDLKINKVFKKLTPNPLLLIVDVNSTDKIDIPTKCYMAVEEIKEDGSSNEKTFIHYPSIIEAEEAEEIGVEHLLRDIRDENRGNLTIALSNNFKSLRSLNEKLATIVRYLTKIISGKLPMNSTILGKLQDVFNLLPNISQISEEASSTLTKSNQIQLQGNAPLQHTDLAQSFNVKTNDQLMILYVSSLVRSIIAFHDLIDNKIENKKTLERAAAEVNATQTTTEIDVAEPDAAVDASKD